LRLQKPAKAESAAEATKNQKAEDQQAEETDQSELTDMDEIDLDRLGAAFDRLDKDLDASGAEV
jgi:hypothetical protein